MKDITMTAPATTVAASEHTDAHHRRLAHALLEQAEAQNRIADQLEELNDRFGSFEAMMHAYMRANSIGLDDINQSLDDIADNTR